MRTGIAVDSKMNVNKNSLLYKLKWTYRKHKYLYLMVIPALILLILFKYVPMYGVLIAFKRYNVSKGVWKSEWVGFYYFKLFLENPYFLRVFKNTFILGFLYMIFGFPAPIIFALMLNELNKQWFKRITQTITYFPHFISQVIIIGMLLQLCLLNGPINSFLKVLGLQPVPFFQRPEWFAFLYISSGIWQNLGWGSIIYLAAISGINPELYEAAIIDGATRFQRIWNITIPSILPTVIIMFILRIGDVLDVDFQKILLMQNPQNYSASDVISTYSYRVGLENFQYSYAAAIGLFMTVIGLVFTIITNYIAKKTKNESLW